MTVQRSIAWADNFPRKPHDVTRDRNVLVGHMHMAILTPRNPNTLKRSALGEKAWRDLRYAVVDPRPQITKIWSPRV